MIRRAIPGALSRVSSCCSSDVRIAGGPRRPRLQDVGPGRSLTQRIGIGMVLLLAAGIFVLPAQAQVITGLPPFGSFSGGPDIVNNANLNVHVSIPVRNKAGRGIPFSYVLSFDSSVWYPVTSGSSQVWTPVTNWGWRAVTEVATGYISYGTGLRPCRDSMGQITQGIYYGGWSYNDSFGVKHGFVFLPRLDDASSPCVPATFSGTANATDGSGYKLTADTSGPTTAFVTSRSGDLMTCPLFPRS